MIRPGLLPAVLLTCLSLALAGPALSNEKRKVRDPSGWSAGGGIGAIASPGQFLLQLDAPYRFSRLLSVGPTFQLGAGSGLTTVSMSLDGKVHLDVFGRMDNAFFANLTPYAGIGAGFTHYSASPFKETNFLIPVLFGFEFDLTENVALTNDMRFNIVATSDVDKFYWSWQLIGVRYRF